MCRMKGEAFICTITFGCSPVASLVLEDLHAAEARVRKNLIKVLGSTWTHDFVFLILT